MGLRWAEPVVSVLTLQTRLHFDTMSKNTLNTVPYWRQCCPIEAVQSFLRADTGYLPQRENANGSMSDIIERPIVHVPASLEKYAQQVTRFVTSPEYFLDLLLAERSVDQVSLHCSAQMVVFDLDIDDFGDLYASKHGCPKEAHAGGQSLCIHCWRQMLVACHFLCWALTAYCQKRHGLTCQPRYLVTYSGSRGIHVFVHPLSCIHLAATDAVKRTEMFNDLRCNWKELIGAGKIAAFFGVDSTTTLRQSAVECDASASKVDSTRGPTWLHEWFNDDISQIWLFHWKEATTDVFQSISMRSASPLPIDMNLAKPRHRIRVPLSPHLKTGYASTPFDLTHSILDAGRALPVELFAIPCHIRDESGNIKEWENERSRRISVAADLILKWARESCQ